MNRLYLVLIVAIFVFLLIRYFQINEYGQNKELFSNDLADVSLPINNSDNFGLQRLNETPEILLIDNFLTPENTTNCMVLTHDRFLSLFSHYSDKVNSSYVHKGSLRDGTSEYYYYCTKDDTPNPRHTFLLFLAPVGGIEPPLSVLETAVLPLTPNRSINI